MLFFEQASDILKYEVPDNVFLIEPYVPMLSIVVLHGMPTLGKTPIGWAMAEAVATGGKFMGIQAAKGNALVLELDMPLFLVVDRWKKAKPPFEPHFSLLFEPGGFDTLALSLLAGDKKHREILQFLLEFEERRSPRLVVVDALREVVRGDLNKTGVADVVYAKWREIFPHSAFVFIHHESKDKDPIMPGDPLQKAKGTMEWLDIAQVGLRLAKDKKGTWLSVTKTQASEIPESIMIDVGGDGVYVR